MAGKAPRFPSEFDTPEKRDTFAEVERIVKNLHGDSFKVKDGNGNFLGPFGVLSSELKTFVPYLEYTLAFFKLPHVTPRERELAILAAVSVTRSEFVEYAHHKIGIMQGMSQDQVEDASGGRVPVGLSDREESIYKLSLNIARGFGMIDDNQFDSAVLLLGKAGISQVAQLVGGYILVSTLVNIGDVRAPKA